MTQYQYNQITKDALQKNLQQFSRQDLQPNSLTKAAVVVTITAHTDTTTSCILLTRRSSTLRKHAGQFALPGGKLDAYETITQAAIRELSEELGIYATEENVIGLLDDFATHSGFCITPFVIWIDSHQSIQANPDEVAKVYEIPLNEVARQSIDQSTEDQLAISSVFFPSVGTRIYSPTAAIIYQFREAALFGRSTRVAHFGQPKFTWR